MRTAGSNTATHLGWTAVEGVPFIALSNVPPRRQSKKLSLALI
jgi:hypothetical protein